LTLQMATTKNDHVKLAQVGAELAKAQARVKSAEETWLALAAEAE